MKYFLIIILAVAFYSGCDTVTESSPAGDLDKIIFMDAHIEEDSYNVLMENKFSNVKVPAIVYIGSSRIPVYFEPQGAGSRYFSKWGYTITCRDGYTISGLNKFNLSIQQYDNSKIRTALASKLYDQAGFPVFYSCHCFLRINESDKGLYVLNERIEDGFLERKGITPYELIKVVFGAKFSFSELNTLSDNFEKKIPDDDNLNNLADFIYALDTTRIDNIPELSQFIDIEGYLRYHALTTIINNVDGITNNFYLYKTNKEDGYRIIPWDFDKAFDAKTLLHLYEGNELMDKLMQSPELKEVYKQQLKYILVNFFNKENLFPVIDSVYKNISAAYPLDPYLKNNVSLDDEINNLKLFIINRRDELLKQLTF